MMQFISSFMAHMPQFYFVCIFVLSAFERHSVVQLMLFVIYSSLYFEHLRFI